MRIPVRDRAASQLISYDAEDIIDHWPATRALSWIKLALPPDAVDSPVKVNRAMFVVNQIGAFIRNLKKSLAAHLKEYGPFIVFDPMPVPC
jgi:hypothetical protein